MSGRFRLVIVGLGVQALKRIRAAGADVMATVDPLKEEATFRRLADVPLDSFDAAAVCRAQDSLLVRCLLYFY